jgi:DNA-binding GntR family transcriptional regulator
VVLEPLPVRSSIVREVYGRLRGAIISGDLPPDTRLYEHRLAVDLGVSRTPVREALAMLDAEELVVSKRHGGTIVRRVTAVEVQETYEVRAVVEGYAARLAAGRITAEQLATLRTLDEEMKRALKDQGGEEERAQRLGELNADFHRVLGDAAGNNVLARAMASLLDTPLYARAYQAYTDRGKRASLADHARMIGLLATGDADDCEQFWREHLYRGRDYMIEQLKSEP